MKLVTRHRSGHGEGVGRVISEGVYLMLQAYTFSVLIRSFWKAGENLSKARPFVGVVYCQQGYEGKILQGIRLLFGLEVSLSLPLEG